MSHPEPHLITLLALGEPACSPQQLAHIESCPGCTADLDRLRAIMAPAEDVGIPVWTAGPEFSPDAQPPTPAPPATAPAAPPARPSPAAPAPAGGALIPPAVGARVEPAQPAPVWVPASEAAPVPRVGPAISGGGMSGTRAAVLALAAALIGLAIGVGATLALDSEDTVTATPAPIPAAASAAPTQAPTVLATATLLATATDALSGSARVLEEDASRVLAVRLSGVTPAEGYREVWLLTPDTNGQVSLGVLTGTSGDLVIPAGLDLAAYPDVDITQEPLDGNPARSATSLARGTLS
ncbi:MAG: anti-sigma factor [Sporichthyaceae bacterium]